MRRFLMLLPGALIIFLAPILACGPGTASRVTPTPTKTPKRVLAIEQTRVPTGVVTSAPVNPVIPEIVSPIETPTPTPLPATDTPTPPPPTATPTPPPPPTDTPVPPPPPPPPTNTPAPPPPNTPAPPPPTQPPANPLRVIVELPDGNTFDTDEEIRFVFVVTDPGGVKEFTWGIFTQNQTSLKGDKHDCGGATECRLEIKESAPPIEGTYIVGADALSVSGKTTRGIGEIYVR